MEQGELIIRWTVRLAMVCYGLTLAIEPFRQKSQLAAAGRVLWTTGCLLFWGHLLAAFHFYHDWSHAHAFADTAEKTAQAIGWKFGWGIYFNHLFVVIWTFDVLWSWLRPVSYQSRPRYISWVIHGYLLFIALNGLVVFKAGWLRWSAITTCLVLIAWREGVSYFGIGNQREKEQTHP